MNVNTSEYPLTEKQKKFLQTCYTLLLDIEVEKVIIEKNITTADFDAILYQQQRTKR